MTNELVLNNGVFDFDLTGDELTHIDRLDTGIRNGPEPDQPRPEFFDRVIPKA